MWHRLHDALLGTSHSTKLHTMHSCCLCLMCSTHKLCNAPKNEFLHHEVFGLGLVSSGWRLQATMHIIWSTIRTNIWDYDSTRIMKLSSPKAGCLQSDMFFRLAKEFCEETTRSLDLPTIQNIDLSGCHPLSSCPPCHKKRGFSSMVVKNSAMELLGTMGEFWDRRMKSTKQV